MLYILDPRPPEKPPSIALLVYAMLLINAAVVIVGIWL